MEVMENNKSTRGYNVLFICTGNSARSILAQAIMNHLGREHFKAYSAGSFPKGEVNPLALETLQRFHYDVSGLRSKSWEEFTGPDAPKMDFVFTVCDKAAGELCPIWPGQPITAHWGFTDPSNIGGSAEEKRAAFSRTFREISQRLRIFLSLPLEKLDRMSLQQELNEMGKVE
jgi:arsenate reductase